MLVAGVLIGCLVEQGPWRADSVTLSLPKQFLSGFR